MRVKIPVTTICSLLCSLLLFSSCEDSFQPTKDDPNTTFSLYGFLDASADTQWVRLIPARQQVDMFDEKPEMNVTLAHLETGNSTVMNDSLILSWDGRHMLVVWTTMDVEPEQSYRLKAERPDGAESYVTVTTPPDFPTPVLKANTNSLSGKLIIEGVERVADVQSLWKEKGRVPYRLFVERTDTSETSYSVSFRIGYVCGTCPGVKEVRLIILKMLNRAKSLWLPADRNGMRRFPHSLI